MHLIDAINVVKTDQIVGDYQGLSKVTISELLTWLREGVFALPSYCSGDATKTFSGNK